MQSKTHAQILQEENAKLKRDKKDQCIMYDDLHKKYTKVLDRMTKAESKIHNIEEGLRRLTSLIIDEYCHVMGGHESLFVENLDAVELFKADNMSLLIDAILIGETTDEA